MDITEIDYSELPTTIFAHQRYQNICYKIEVIKGDLYSYIKKFRETLLTKPYGVGIPWCEQAKDDIVHAPYQAAKRLQLIRDLLTEPYGVDMLYHAIKEGDYTDNMNGPEYLKKIELLLCKWYMEEQQRIFTIQRLKAKMDPKNEMA